MEKQSGCDSREKVCRFLDPRPLVDNTIRCSTQSASLYRVVAVHCVCFLLSSSYCWPSVKIVSDARLMKRSELVLRFLSTRCYIDSTRMRQQLAKSQNEFVASTLLVENQRF